MVKSDFSLTKGIVLTYPEGHEDIEYRKLVSFYKELIDIIPDDISIILLCINKHIVNKVLSLFPRKKIKPIISGMEEIWLRDIMGFKLKNKVFCPIFNPDYFTKYYTTKHIQYIQKEISKVHETSGISTQNLPIILDGGNFITNGKHAILTDKTLKHHTRNYIIKELQEKLNIKPIIIPQLKGDLLGHSDGIVNFINEYTIALSSYPNDSVFLSEERKSLEIIKTQLLEYGFRIVEIKDSPVFENHITEEGTLPSAVGIYINYIQINNLIILPEFTLSKNNSAFDYNEFNKKQLVKQGFEVKTINCDEIGKLGGGLRCLSWTF